MNEKFKNILKIAGIGYAITFGIGILLLVLEVIAGYAFNHVISAEEVFLRIFYGLISPILLVIFYLIIFSPAILILYFLFKKIKNTKGRIFLTAILLPLNNLLYFFIEYIYSDYSPIFSVMIGAFSLFVVVPLIFIIVMLIPQKILQIKWQAVITIVLTGIFGWIFVIFTYFLIATVMPKADAKNLEKYDVIIENLEGYKKQNGVYPKTTEDNIKKFHYFKYEPINDDKDYILTVYNTYSNHYNYCTTPEPVGCHPDNKYYYMIYKQFGKWIEAIDDD